VIPLPGASSAYLCVVADGQGGQAGGACAAAIACHTCLKTASSFRVDQLLSPRTWPAILRQSDETVAIARDAGFTTLIALCLTENAICGASSGDSAILLLNAGQPPHTLTERQVKNPPVGSRGAVFMPFASQLVKPWTLLAMTDGVWKYVGWESVLAVVATEKGRSIIEKLREKALLQRTRLLQDDFTLAVFQG
jgi:hypothetical protein